MGHSTRCIPLVGNMPSLLIPQRGNVRRVGSGIQVSAGIQIPADKALVVVSATPYTIEVEQTGELPWVLSTSEPATRFLFPSRASGVLFTCTDILSWYLEDVSTLAATHVGDGV